MVTPSITPDAVRVHITLDIPLETMLSPRGDLYARDERELPEVQTLIEDARLDDLPSSDDDLLELVQTVLEAR